jgi:hypothetical protein
MGLPEFDIIRVILDDREEVAGTAASLEHLDPDTTELWWAGKEFLRDQVCVCACVCVSVCMCVCCLVMSAAVFHPRCRCCRTIDVAVAYYRCRRGVCDDAVDLSVAGAGAA